MNDGDNPYQGPEARRGEFSVRRRPMTYTVAGSLCWFFATGQVLGLCGFVIPTLVRLCKEYGWKTVLFSEPGIRMVAGIGLIGLIIPALVFAGRSFLDGRGRRGLILGCLAFGVGGLARYLLR